MTDSSSSITECLLGNFGLSCVQVHIDCPAPPLEGMSEREMTCVFLFFFLLFS